MSKEVFLRNCNFVVNPHCPYQKLISIIMQENNIIYVCFDKKVSDGVSIEMMVIVTQSCLWVCVWFFLVVFLGCVCGGYGQKFKITFEMSGGSKSCIWSLSWLYPFWSIFCYNRKWCQLLRISGRNEGNVFFLVIWRHTYGKGSLR